MMKRFSLLLLILFIISSCSDQPYKKGRNSHSVIYRGQKPTPRVEMKKPTHSEIDQRNKALADSKHNRRDVSEDSFHEITPAVQVTTAVTQKYIQDYKDIAMVEMQRYNIPASITLAQGILESGSGQGRLARYGNNHFGIKCHATWDGKTITHDDDEKSECFRKYRYAYESFEDHSQFLVNRNRYKALFDLSPTDYEGWAHGLRKAGYATDPTYAKKLIALIKKFELHQYDNQVIVAKGGDITSSNTQVATVLTPKKEVSKPATAIKSVSKPTVTKTIVKPTNTIDTTTIEKEAIAEVYYQVQTGDTLYKIAREQQVPVQQLMKLNNFDDVTSSNLKVGQQIRVN